MTYYTIFRLKQLAEPTAALYLLCFMQHRYQRLHDNLLNSLIHHVRRYMDEAKNAAKEQVYAYQRENNENLQKAGRVLQLFTDDNIEQNTPFQTVQWQAFAILERQKLAHIAEQIASNASFDETAFQWEHVTKLASQFKRHLRPILLAVAFAAPSSNDPLLAAIQFWQAVLRKEKTLTTATLATCPTQFIPANLKRYLYASEPGGRKRLLLERYEFLLYRVLRQGLEAGEIFCRDSVRFRSFEDDLINEQQWRQKEELLATTGLTLLKQPIQEHLAALEQRLEERIERVNQRITAGENEHFQIKRQGQQMRWTLHYPGNSEPLNHPFFDALQPVEISRLLHFVNQQCHFLAAFAHVSYHVMRNNRWTTS